MALKLLNIWVSIAMNLLYIKFCFAERNVFWEENLIIFLRRTIPDNICQIIESIQITIFYFVSMCSKYNLNTSNMILSSIQQKQEFFSHVFRLLHRKILQKLIFLDENDRLKLNSSYSNTFGRNAFSTEVRTIEARKTSIGSQLVYLHVDSSTSNVWKSQ